MPSYQYNQTEKIPIDGSWASLNVGVGSGLWRVHLYAAVTDEDDPNSPANNDAIGNQVTI